MRDQRASAPSTLSNDELLSATRALVARSNEATAHLVAHLAEIDARKLYLDQAQPSMFSWCVVELGCSEDVACNWITVARASRSYPLVLDALREGKVHLTGLRMLAPHLTGAGHRALLDEAAGKSKREIEELIAKVAPRPAVAASIRKLPLAGSSRGKESAKQSRCGAEDSGNGEVGKGDLPGGTEGEEQAGWPAPGFTASAVAGQETAGDSVVESGSPANDGASADGGTLPMGDAYTESSDPAAPVPHQRPRAIGRVEPLSEEAYKVTFTASRRLRDKIRQAQDLLGHQVRGGDLAEIVERGLDLLVEEVKKKRFAVGRRPKRAGTKDPNRKTAAATRQARQESPEQESPTFEAEATAKATQDSAANRSERPSRHIPAEVRRAVYERDGGQCSFVDERGRRCPATGRLELDHAEGFARVGLHTVDGLRLRCKPHNAHHAEQLYGRAFMEKKRAAAKSSAPARVVGSSPPSAP